MSLRRERRSVAVTGAAGGIGSRVIRALTSIDSSRTVVALARDPSRVLKPESGTGTVRPAYADYDDIDSLIAALDGSSSLIFVSSDGDIETMLRHHRNVLSVLAAVALEHVVYMSIIDIAIDSPFYYAPVHRETEELLRGTGIPCCFARTSVFADFFFATFLKSALEVGVVELPMLNGSISLVTRDDVAEALAAVSVREVNGELALTGPAALHRQEIEGAVRSAYGCPLSVSAIGEDSYRLQMRKAGMAPWRMEAFSTMFRSIEQGRFSDVSGDIEQLVGHRPATFSSFLSTSTTTLNRGSTDAFQEN
jgi:NAD(P)H dehydrogenase (quinone)